MKRYVVLLMALCFLAAAVMPAAAVQKMSKEELKKLLDDPDVIVLDARRGYDWDASEFMIKGAVRIGQDIGLVQREIPKDMTLVLY
jgi:predicted sulfurtransferase